MNNLIDIISGYFSSDKKKSSPAGKPAPKKSALAMAKERKAKAAKADKKSPRKSLRSKR